MELIFVPNIRFSPSLLSSSGLGGSESSAVHLASTLAAKGHSVTVYSPLEDDHLTTPVAYRRIETLWPSIFPDFAVHYRTSVAALVGSVRGHRTVFWCTDVPHSRLLPIGFTRLACLLCISAFQERVLRAFYPDRGHTHPQVIGQGVVRSDYEGPGLAHLPATTGSTLCYGSIPGRGLIHLLASWFPLIQAKVADAELFITSDYTLWGQAHGTDKYRTLFQATPLEGSPGRS